MDYKELLEVLRKDLNFKKVDLYQEKSNKTRYREIELGEKSPTIEELISFTDTLGIRLSEFLYRGDITPLAASYYGKRKIEVASLINNFPELEKQFPEIYKDRFKNLQCYTLFTLCLIISKSLNNSLYTFKNKDIRELKNFYKNREVILGADYAILSHLYMAVPEYSNELDFLTENSFPLTNLMEISMTMQFSYVSRMRLLSFLKKRILKKLITSLNNLILFEKSLLLF